MNNPLYATSLDSQKRSVAGLLLGMRAGTEIAIEVGKGLDAMAAMHIALAPHTRDGADPLSVKEVRELIDAVNDGVVSLKKALGLAIAIGGGVQASD